MDSYDLQYWFLYELIFFHWSLIVRQSIYLISLVACFFSRRLAILIIIDCTLFLWNSATQCIIKLLFLKQDITVLTRNIIYRLSSQKSYAIGWHFFAAGKNAFIYNFFLVYTEILVLASSHQLYCFILSRGNGKRFVVFFSPSLWVIAARTLEFDLS